MTISWYEWHVRLKYVLNGRQPPSPDYIQLEKEQAEQERFGPLVLVHATPRAAGERKDLPKLRELAFRELVIDCTPEEFGRIWKLAKDCESGLVRRG